MPLSNKYFPAACMAAAAVLQGAAAQSSGGCTINASSSSRIEIQDAVSRAWLDIGAYACGDQAAAGEPRIENIDMQVAMVARAYAEALAEITGGCSSQGNARVSASGTASAQARATAYGEAISRVFADAEVCGLCTAAVDAVSRTSRQLVAEATADAWIDISVASTQGSSDSTTFDIVVEDIQETVADVLASIVGTIRSGANDGCSITVINEAQVGDFFARCELDVSADSRVVEVDAIAMAGAAARSYACAPSNEVNEAMLTQIAQATARALAEAVAQADVFCEQNGGEGTSACGLAESNIEVVARAQAEAFAEAFASARTCGCDVEQHAEVSLWEEIFVSAAAASYAETCADADGTGSSFETDFQFEVEERMITATAQAITFAVSRASEDSDSCGTQIQPCARITECAARIRVCRGPDTNGVLPCCDSDYHCVRRNDEESRCRRISAPIPSFYEGTIEPPTICNPAQ